MSSSSDSIGDKPRSTFSRIRKLWWWLIPLILLGALYRPALTLLGEWLLHEQPLAKADAAVVLAGPEYPARLIQAAQLYQRGEVERVVINGNRNEPGLLWLAEQGYQPDVPWYIKDLSVLRYLGVPAQHIEIISAPDVRDTLSEAEFVGQRLLQKGLAEITVVTSQYHTRRARLVWRDRWGEQLQIGISGATQDGFEPDTWWYQPRFIRAVVAELGGYVQWLASR